jgi:hypothetical protein
MKVKTLMFALLIAKIGNAQQQLNISAKILSFKEPYHKMKVEVTDETSSDLSTITVTHLSKFLNSNGKEISLKQFKEGSEYNFSLKKTNNRAELISVSSGNAELTAIAEDSPKTNNKQEENSFFTGNASTSIGLGIGSTLKPFTGIDKSKVGKSLIWENRINKLDLGSFGFLSAGGYFGIKTFKDMLDRETDEYLNSYTYVTFGVRAALHLLDYKPIKRWDPYLGFMYSFNLRFSNTPTNAADKFLSNNISGFLGSRFYVIKNLAFFLEAGFGINYLNFGLTFNSGLLSPKRH